MPDADESVEVASFAEDAAAVSRESQAEPEVEPEVFEPDAALLGAVDIARAALLEVTPAATVGDVVGHLAHGEHVLSLYFATTQAGYPGWKWTVTLSRLDADAEPNVLEVELLPGDGALLAPDWTPWSVRLADYEAAQHGDDEFENDESDDDADLDDADLDDDETDESDDDDADIDDADLDDDEDEFDDQVILSDLDEDDETLDR
ncbi:DUF3027 domain-containing protein [Microbacteriaceae bacterium VKM Ac-2855]|nr:DUF3027 domain-containing protein [Microbacteriaceae bacterium VKM Ac-2855]